MCIFACLDSLHITDGNGFALGFVTLSLCLTRDLISHPSHSHPNVSSTRLQVVSRTQPHKKGVAPGCCCARGLMRLRGFKVTRNS